MENLFLEVLELLTSVAYTRNRKPLFSRIDDDLNRLRVLVRLSHEIKVISDGQYQMLAAALLETGRMIGGWKKVAVSDGCVRLGVSSENFLEITVEQ